MRYIPEEKDKTVKGKKTENKYANLIFFTFIVLVFTLKLLLPSKNVKLEEIVELTDNIQEESAVTTQEYYKFGADPENSYLLDMDPD